MDEQTPDRDQPTPEVDPAMALLLARRHGRTRKAAGPEPLDLERVARHLDGELGAAESRAMEDRLARDPELGEVVARLRDLEGDRKVVPLVPKAEHRGGAPVVRRITLGLGAVIALAAILFLVVRGSAPRDLAGSAGAGVGAQGLALDFQWVDGAACTAELRLAPGLETSLAAVTPSGSVALGTFTGSARVTIPACATERCIYVIGSSPPAAASTFAGLVSADCVVKPFAATGARLGLVRVP